jgi:hypothetical protein
MESIKKAVGLGTEKQQQQQQQGREPVNGEAGAGTAGEPYDQGNSGGKIFNNTYGVFRWKLTVCF